MILKETSAKKFEKQLENDIGTLRYLKVYMKLSEVIDGEFFNQYIKAGRSSRCKRTKIHAESKQETS